MYSKSKLNGSRKVLFVLVLLVLLAGSFILIYKYTSLLKNKPSLRPTTTNAYTKGLNSNSRYAHGVNQTVNNAKNTNNSLSASSSTNNSTTAVLLQPSGDFVSNHHPDLSGSPSPNVLTSVCNTTPGATCQIFFNMNNAVRSLPMKTANSGGSVFWQNWSLQSINLYQGSWKISVVAKLGDQTKTAFDPMDLTVQQ